jgi:plastocyanin
MEINLWLTFNSSHNTRKIKHFNANRGIMRTVIFLALLCAAPISAGATTVAVTVQDTEGRPLRDAVVSIQSSATRPGTLAQFAGPMKITQQDIKFDPFVLLVQKGARVSFPNRDRVRHHVYSFSKAKKFELKLYGREDDRAILFDVPGTVALGCNIHDQMQAFIRVVDTPWAGKTDANGRVVIDGIPGGGATITVWHPRARAKNGEFAAALPLPASGAISKIISLKASAP